MSGTDADTASDEESRIVVYAVPFVGVLLIAVGIPSAILGGYVVVQDTIGLCNDPDVTVTPLEDEEADTPRETVERLPYDRLSPAEQAAVREAIDGPTDDATVQGDLENRATLREGVIVDVDGRSYYVTIASLNSCLEAEPLLFPIGVVAILLGVVGVLTPPIYRRMAGFEERMEQRPPRE